jgi:hypothetical protein
VNHARATGINTGPCITGDADCDGNPGAAGALLQSEDISAVDRPVLDEGEFALIVIDFGASNTQVYVPVESNPNLAVVGVPTSTSDGVEFLGTMRVARVIGAPRNGFGASITAANVIVYNYVSGSSTLIGPSSTRRHLEFSVQSYSSIPLALGSTWDPVVACIAMSAIAGSIDDGPIGEDSMTEKQNCPSVTPSPSPSATSTGTSVGLLFTSVSTITTGTTSWRILSLDMDRDGSLDAVVCYYQGALGGQVRGRAACARERAL